MSIDLELPPKRRRAAGERCCEPVEYPDVEREHALRMAEVARRSAGGIVDSQRRGLWAYYYVRPDALKELSAWLSRA
ncbi:MAG: ArsR family transcriptional regulator, arsenate/arsenite/antimonite-responsive transcriptional [Solirubrobacteraceae bacterium]|jgi:ArsR family transcriptional regulator|nr:ArsR family transcriptional regulator, arsenate/arsenite/antimonite-responsive transcriptional [Solirubrobacteraceae bacterium]